MFDFTDAVVLISQLIVCILMAIVWKKLKIQEIVSCNTQEYRAVKHTHAPLPQMTDSLETRIVGDPLPMKTLFSLYSRSDLRIPHQPRIAKVVLRRDNSIHAYDADNGPLPQYTGPYNTLRATIFEKFRGNWYVSENGKSMSFKTVKPTYQDIMSGRDLHELPAVEVNA